MKKLFTFGIFCLTSTLSVAQWLGTNPVYFIAGNVGIGTSTPVVKLHVGITGTSTNYGAYTNSDVSLALQNKTSVNNNLNIIGFSDATGFGVADIGVITNHTGHAGKLFFATRSSTSGSYPIQRMLIDEKGYVGIGTVNPANYVQIGSNPAGYANNDFVVSNANGTLAIHNDINSTFLYGSKAVSLWAGNGNMALYAQTNGNVGIGTTNPDFKLTVNGKIKAEEIQVVVDVADYVFEKDYKRLSLEEVEEYIQNNKHLPNIPSAAEVKERGYNIGEMNNKLLEKIEELTLYIIEQEKRIKQLEKEHETKH